MLFRNYIFFLVLAFGLSSCGFEPVLAKKEQSGVSKINLQVTGEPGSGTEGYVVYKFKRELRSLLDRLSFKNNSYRVSVILKDTQGHIGYGSDATILRAQERLIAKFEISKELTPFYKSTADSVSSYTLNSQEEFANLSAKSGTQERVVIALAEEVSREISIAIRNQESEHAHPSFSNN